MLTKKEFEVLLFQKDTNHTQREIAGELKLALGSINKTLNDLKQKKLLNNDSSINSNGLEALKHYQVKNAIIMAAGTSSRFAPLSYEKPKGLLKVKGEVLIERQIKQLHQIGINDITIVIGYLKEQFFYLEEKYGVKLIVNEDYYRYNNTTTLWKVKDQLTNTYICSSDNYFPENIYQPYVYQAYYSVETTTETHLPQEYFVQLDNKQRIIKVSINAGNDYYMKGPAYFDQNFSTNFVNILKENITDEVVKLNLWEKLLANHLEELPIYAEIYQPGIIYEFDSLDELRDYDPLYLNYEHSDILKNIANYFKCEVKDIVAIEAIKEGLTNTSFKFEIGDKAYVYRHPGVGTEEYINRKSEAFSHKIASQLNLDTTFIFMDAEQGYKISRYVPDTVPFDYHNQEHVTKALNLMKTLHNKKAISPFDFNIKEKTQEFISKIKTKDRHNFKDFDTLEKEMQLLYNYTEQDNFPIILCHADCYAPNFLLNKDEFNLIDYEYSGNSDPGVDLGTFICCSDYTFEQGVDIIKQYLGDSYNTQSLAHYLAYTAIASYYWFIWAIFQESNGQLIGEYLYLWYKNAKDYKDAAFKLYKEIY